MLRFYANTRLAYVDIKYFLKEMFDSKSTNKYVRSKEKVLGINEIFGFAWEIEDPSDVFDLIREIDKDSDQRIKLLKDRAKGFVAGISTAPPDDRTYTYATRITDQMTSIIGNIKTHRAEPNRQAFLSIWDPRDSFWLGMKEVPCSIGYHFIPRDDKLHMVYFMRSLDIDIWPNDVYLSRAVQEYVAIACNMEVGRIIFMVSCLHLFEE